MGEGRPQNRLRLQQAARSASCDRHSRNVLHQWGCRLGLLTAGMYCGDIYMHALDVSMHSIYAFYLYIYDISMVAIDFFGGYLTARAREIVNRQGVLERLKAPGIPLRK